MNPSRNFDSVRKAQGFTSQEQLDAFFAYADHGKACADCQALNSFVELSEGIQPTQGQCAVAKALYLTYLEAL